MSYSAYEIQLGSAHHHGTAEVHSQFSSSQSPFLTGLSIAMVRGKDLEGIAALQNWLYTGIMGLA